MATDPRVHALRMKEYNVPQRLRHLRLDDIDCPEADLAREWLSNLRDHYVTDKRPLTEYPEDWSQIGKGLMFVGPPGTGKTSLATATLLEVYYVHRLPVYFAAFADYVALSVEQMSLKDRPEPEANHRWWEIQDMLVTAEKVPVLLLDDVGKEHRTKTGYAERVLDTLLRQRHRDSKPTLLTTNMPKKERERIYDHTMGSFMREAFRTVSMLGEDRRVA